MLRSRVPFGLALSLLLAGCSGGHRGGSSSAGGPCDGQAPPIPSATTAPDASANAFQLRNIRGDQALRSSSDSITVDGGSGNLALASTSGSIDIRNVGGALVLQSSSGSVTIFGFNGNVQASTSNGSITIQGKLCGRNVLKSGSGGVTVTLASGSNLTLSVKTASGSINNAFRGNRVGDGSGGSLDITTDNGSITIR